MRLALFDLDHTLIPYDSGMAWLQFLVAHGRLPPEAEAAYLEQCRRYVDGRATIEDMHGALLRPMREISRASLEDWLAEFEAGLTGRLPAASMTLVTTHREAGDRCILVTATTRCIAARYAAAFGIGEVLASEALADSNGRLTGTMAGPPCAGPHKLAKVKGWLKLEDRSIADFERSWFYSDSASDLPLLEAVSHPVAVRPDARLLAVAQERGWRVESLRD